MILRSLKDKLANKFTKIFIISCLAIMIFIFVTIKGEFFYSTVNYIANYFDYYVSEYLHGIHENLYLGGTALIHVEGDLQNMFSSIYIYGVTFGTTLYNICLIVIPLFIFYKVSNEYFCEIYKNSSVSKITRLGIKKYVNSNLISNSIYYGLLVLIPKVVYFIILCIFYPTGVSFTHFISGLSSVLSPFFMYTSYSFNPYILIIMDFILSFFYGIIIYFLSLGVISLNRKLPKSYFVFIFIISLLSLISSLTYQVPIIFYSSIFGYFSQISSHTIGAAYTWAPIISAIVISIILGIISKLLFKKALNKNL